MSSWIKIVVLSNVSLNYISCLDGLSRSLSYRFPVVFSHTWTSYAWVLKMPRVSNAFMILWRLWCFRSKMQTKMILRPLPTRCVPFFQINTLLFWSVTLLPGTVHSLQLALQVWLLAKFRSVLPDSDFGNWIKISSSREFLLKANYYPAYITADWPDWTVPSNSQFSLKTFYVVRSFL